MSYKEKETSKGVLKYRMPNILEVYDLLEDSGFATGEKSPLKLKRNIIKLLEPFLDMSGIEGAEKFDDLISMVDDMAIPLSEIADEVMGKSFSAFKKKN